MGAEIRVRRVYETTAGDRLEEGFRINGYVVFRNNVTSRLARGLRVDAVLVRPGAAKIDVAGSFSHVEFAQSTSPTLRGSLTPPRNSLVAQPACARLRNTEPRRARVIEDCRASSVSTPANDALTRTPRSQLSRPP